MFSLPPSALFVHVLCVRSESTRERERERERESTDTSCFPQTAFRMLKAFSHQRIAAWLAALLNAGKVNTGSIGQCKKMNGIIFLHWPVSVVQKRCTLANATSTRQQINAGSLGVKRPFRFIHKAQSTQDACGKFERKSFDVACVQCEHSY